MRNLTDDEKSLWDKVAATVSQSHKSKSRKRQSQNHPDPKNRVLDLHGMTIANAHAAVLTALEEAKSSNARNLLIITGKSGEINREFPEWINNARHEAQNGGGAYRVYFPKKQNKSTTSRK